MKTFSGSRFRVSALAPLGILLIAILFPYSVTGKTLQLPPAAAGVTIHGSRTITARGPWMPNETHQELQNPKNGHGSGLVVPASPDPSTLRVIKSGSQVSLDWTGTGPFTLTYSPDPSFQDKVQTLGIEMTGASQLLDPDPSKMLECYSITDNSSGSFVSPAVQGMGYDPDPAPVANSLSSNDLWWNRTVTVSGQYLDKIAAENVLFFNHRPQKANLATAGSGRYATDASFLIPDDARTGDVILQAHGRTSIGSNLYLTLAAPGIGLFSNIRNVVYAPQTGRIWIAADGIIEEVDFFKRAPAPILAHRITTASKPYLSRATTGGKILYIDGINGVSKVKQIDVLTGGVSDFANTTGGSFTRPILPVGIAVSHDGNYCFIADASLRKIVRIRLNNASPIVDNFGANTWNFSDPTGMDGINLDSVLVGDASGFVGYTFGGSTYYGFGTAPDIATSIEIDWDVSNTNIFQIWPEWNVLPTAQSYNLNSIEPSTNIYRVGAFVEGRGDGKLELDPLLFGSFTPPDAPPAAVILNNSGQSASYPSSNQVADRVLEMMAQGLGGLKIKLELIDPPDLAAYATRDLNNQTGWPANGYPYKANDNKGSADYGLMAAPNGTPTSTLTLDTNGLSTFYLKVPARYSGDNFQVAVHKCNYANVCDDNKIAYLSEIHTSWKRVFVERDKMFRQGGLLKLDAAAGSIIANVYGWANLPTCGSIAGASPCYQIAIFDSENTFEEAHDEPYVGWVTDDGTGTGDLNLHLVNANMTNYASATGAGLRNNYTSSPYPTLVDANTDPAGKSAGLGVISPCDRGTNQINGVNSCFFDPDMRNIEPGYADAFVQFIAPRSGTNALPFIPQSFFDGAGANGRIRLSILWFDHWIPGGGGTPPVAQPHNHFHLIGVSRSAADYGITGSSDDYSYVYVGSVEDQGGANSPAQGRWVTVHENGHQFVVNSCTSPAEDTRLAWCDLWQHCALGGATPQGCVMYINTLQQIQDGVDRFDVEDLLDGDPNCAPPPPGTAKPGAIRTDQDPQ